MTSRTDHEAQPFEGVPIRGATSPRRERRVRDGSLAEWRVYERVCGQADHGSVRLVFESDMAIRTLARYPSLWSELSDEELLAMSKGPPGE